MNASGTAPASPAQFPAPIGFEWDGANLMANERYAVSDAEAEQVLFNQPLLLLVSGSHWHALGRTNEHRLLKVTLVPAADGKRVRIISARPMHRKERNAYEQATQAHP